MTKLKLSKDFDRQSEQTTLTDLLTKNGKRRVSVTYPDGKGNHETTLRDLGDRFLHETAEWRRQFFESLVKGGIAFTKFGGKYQIELEG